MYTLHMIILLLLLYLSLDEITDRKVWKSKKESGKKYKTTTLYILVTYYRNTRTNISFYLYLAVSDKFPRETIRSKNRSTLITFAPKLFSRVWSTISWSNLAFFASTGVVTTTCDDCSSSRWPAVCISNSAIACVALGIPITFEVLILVLLGAWEDTVGVCESSSVRGFVWRGWRTRGGIFPRGNWVRSEGSAKKLSDARVPMLKSFWSVFFIDDLGLSNREAGKLVADTLVNVWGEFRNYRMIRTFLFLIKPLNLIIYLCVTCVFWNNLYVMCVYIDEVWDRFDNVTKVFEYKLILIIYWHCGETGHNIENIHRISVIFSANTVITKFDTSVVCTENTH